MQMTKYPTQCYVCFEKGSRTGQVTKIQPQKGGGVIPMPGKKKFQIHIPACVLLGKNFRNGVPLQKYS
jgi:hypothetical protein